MTEGSLNLCFKALSSETRAKNPFLIGEKKLLVLEI